MRYRYAGVIAINPNTDRAEVVKSATGTVHINEDWETPVVVQDPNGFDMTTLNTTVEGLFPDFYVEEHPVVGFKTSSGHRFYLRSSTPVPGPVGPPPSVVTTVEGAFSFEYPDGTKVAGPAIPTPEALADEKISGLVEDSATATGASVRSAVLAAAIDPLQWQTSRAFDVSARPRRDDTPTVTWATGSGTTLSAPAEFKPSIVGTGAKVTGWDGQDDPIFQFDPGTFETSVGVNSDVAVVGMMKPGGSAQYAGWPVSVSFVAGATDVVEIPAYSGRANSQLILEVNGRQVDDAYLWPPTSDTGYSRTLTLRFPTVGTRTIHVSGHHAWGFGAVRVATGGTVTKPTTAGRLAAVIGDSFTNGAGTSTSFPSQGAGTQETFAPRLFRMLGYNRMMLAGIGGTGYTTASPYSERVPAVLAANPNMLMLFGTVNDGNATESALQAAIESVLTSVVGVPEVLVVPPGVATHTKQPRALKAAVEATGVGRYIDLGGFFYGTGKVTAPTGDGNNDVFLMDDGTHPTLDGHRALARELYGLLAP